MLLDGASWIPSNNCFHRSLLPRSSHHRMFGEPELSHHAPAIVWAYAINPVGSGAGFHLHCDGAEGVILSDEPHLPAVGLFRNITSQVLTGHHLVGMLPQSDLPTLSPLGDRSCSSLGWRTSSLATSLMCVPLDAMKQDSRPPGPSFGPPAVTNISAVTGSPLAAAAATFSLSSTLHKRLTLEQRASFVRVRERLLVHLHAVACAASCASPAVARVSHCFRLRPRVPHGQRRRICRLPVSFCQRQRKNTTAMDLSFSPQWMMAVSSSAGLAGFAPVPLRPPVLA